MTATSRAAVSYLMMQGEFGGVSSTYRWSVTYDDGALLTGRDLLTAIFGTTSPHPDPDLEAFVASSHGFDTEYIFGNDFLYSVTNPQGHLLAEDGFESKGWASYSALGGYSFYAEVWEEVSPGVWQPVLDDDDNPVWALYSDTYSTDWTKSGSGFMSRSLVDGSFDALVYGFYNPTTYNPLSPLTGTPLVSEYMGSALETWSGSMNGHGFTVTLHDTAAIPEPGRGLLLLLGATGVLLRRKRCAISA